MRQIEILIKKILIVDFFFLILMSIFRGIFFFYFNEISDLSKFTSDIISMFIMGARLDLTVIGYIQVLPSLILLFLYFTKPYYLSKLNSLFTYYFFITFGIVSLFLATDFGFYSFFKEHINTMIFGIIDDDTYALWITLWQGYPVISVILAFTFYLGILFFIIKKTFFKNFKCKEGLIFKNSFVFFIVLIALNFLAIRGTFGMFPLGKMLPNISTNDYINKTCQNGFRCYIDALKIRRKANSNKQDFFDLTHFKNIQDALKVYTNNEKIDEKNPINNLIQTSRENHNSYNVVVIMVESFGMPILKYQSKNFDIMGKLKKHFSEDFLFTNAISEGDGTIASLQSLLLNIPNRPGTFPLSKGNFSHKTFSFSPALLLNKNDFNTTFIYGGDLTWENVGNFAKIQGWKNTFGKMDIYNSLNDEQKNGDNFHPWGIYDEYLYNFIFTKLQNAQNSNKKEFILALSTNNHPPFNLPKNWEKTLHYNENLKAHISGDFDLAKKRFLSYAYALDSLGEFLDKIKNSKLANNTIIVVTADNNTVEGIMKYDKNPNFTRKNIPIYFYLPPKLKAQISPNLKIACDHKDIFPTIFNLVLDEQKYISLGYDLFDESLPHYGFNGSLICTDGNKTQKLKSLSQENTSKMQEYYKANIAITDWLIKDYE